jgi:ribose 5-phosphate isomerase B
VVNGTGVSACIAANKIKGIRAALCHDVTTTISAREHSDANVLALAGSLIGPRLATAIVETFLTREFVVERYAARLEKLKALDEER